MAPMPPMPPFEAHAGLMTEEPATQAFPSRHSPTPIGGKQAPVKPLPPPPGSGSPRPGGILPTARQLKV